MKRCLLKKLYSLFLTSICINSLSAQTSQFPSDLMELGITGRVKTMTVYTYPAEQIIKDSTQWKIKDKDFFDMRREFYLNQKGQIDSIITISPYRGSGTLILYRSYVIYEFNQSGIKKGYRFYNGDRKLEQETEIKWLDEYHYVQTNFTFDTGRVRQKNEEIWYSLNKNGREISYEIRTFVPWTVNDSEISVVVNTLENGRYLEKKSSQSYIQNGWGESFYEIQKKDANGNPLETVRLKGVRRTPTKMEVAEYSYFK